MQDALFNLNKHVLYPANAPTRLFGNDRLVGMDHEKHNQEMAATIQRRVVGRLVTDVAVNGRDITISIDGGTTLNIRGVQEFEIESGERRFVTGKVGRPNEHTKVKLCHVYYFSNGLVAVTGVDHQQIPEFQGRFEDVRDRILKAADTETEFHGWPGR